MSAPSDRPDEHAGGPALGLRLTLGLVGGMALIFALAGGLLHFFVSESLTEQFDQGLLARARGLSALVELDSEGVEFDDPSDVIPEYAGGSSPEYFTLWLSDRPNPKTSATLADAALEQRAGDETEPLRWDLELPDGRSGRALGLAFPLVPEEGEGDEEEDAFDSEDALAAAAPGLGPDSAPAEDGAPAPATDAATAAATDAEPLRLTIVVAASRESLDVQLAALRRGLLLVGLFGLALVGGGVPWAVRRGLLPVRRLGDQVERVDAGSLDTRLVADEVPRELVPVVDKLNQLLGRLSAAFERQQRMTAAMAHELRTPIAELRSASDVARRWPDDAQLAAEVLATAEETSRRMSRSVEAVMHYCRLQAGSESLQPESVAPAALIDELWLPCAERADVSGLEFLNELPESLRLDTDKQLLELLFRNLLDNAASFADAGEVRVWRSAGEAKGVWIHVENACAGLRPEDLARLSEPFWRADAARADGAHSGLGLSLVSSLAEVLGGSVRFGLVEGRFVVSVGLRGGHVEDSPRASSSRHAPVSSRG